MRDHSPLLLSKTAMLITSTHFNQRRMCSLLSLSLKVQRLLLSGIHDHVACVKVKSLEGLIMLADSADWNDAEDGGIE